MDTGTNTVVTSIGVGRIPDGVAVNRTGTRVYVANTDSNSVSFIDTAIDGVVATVAVGTQPVGIAVTSRGDRVYVANPGSNSVSVIDTAGKAVIATIAVGAQPAALGELIGQAAAPAVNYQGLWWNAPAYSEPYWGINFAHQGDRVFGTWYTYDTTGKAWWLSMLASRGAGNTYSGPIYVDTGPPFDNFAGAGVPTEIGLGTLTFSDANNGSFNYYLNTGSGGSPVAVIQTKPLARFDLGTGPQPTCTFSTTADLAAATNYQDVWWAASGTESGWGVNFAHQGDHVFATWFTYDSSHAPLWLSALLQRQGTSNVYSGPMTRTSGSCFNNYKATDVAQATVGTATVIFANGDNATFNYTTNGNGGLPAGVNQSKAIVRFQFGPGGTVCQQTVPG
jgi:YVTN family beta-propeller protein